MSLTDPDPALPFVRRLARERRARLEAESLAEQGLRELFQRQQEIQLLGTIAEAANTATSVEEAMQFALNTICVYTKWPLGHYCAVVIDPLDEENSQITSSDTWHLPPQTEGVTATALDQMRRFASDLGLPARILANRKPVWITDLARERTVKPLAAAGRWSVRGAVGFPVMAGHDVAAVLEFFSPTEITPDQGLLEVFIHLGTQLGRVIERQRAQDQMIDAFHDPLTHLPNRGLFLRYVERAVKREGRHPTYKFAVLFIDLDGFKAVNDSLGHMAGDELLVQIGRRLTDAVREEDAVARALPTAAKSGSQESKVARLGGDEFTVLLEDISDISDGFRVAERIQRVLAAPFALGHQDEVFVSASIGIASSMPGHLSAQDVLRDADIAMYRAKATGKGHSEIFDQRMHQRAVARLQLETDLRHAVERGELRLAYQPIVALEDGATWGYEALVRWQHPVKGCIGPSDFIPIAEDGGAILEIGGWVLREACRQLHAWQQRFSNPTLVMAVNLSGKQFAQANLVEQITQVLQATGVQPESLSLELTESVAMGSGERSRRLLADLSDAGMHLAIDDFGTGYSSLSYLKQFRVDCLKIDRSFIRQMDDRDGQALVHAILTLGANLGLTVVAEGVETARQLEQLRRLGCTHVQGYYYGRPAEALEIERGSSAGWPQSASNPPFTAPDS